MSKPKPAKPEWSKRSTDGVWKQTVCIRLPPSIIRKVEAAGGMHVVIDRGLGKGAK